MRFPAITTLFSLLLLSAGCVTNRSTTTTRTALEMALISESAENAIATFAMPDLRGERVHLDESPFEATDEEFQLSALRLALLRAGATEVADPDEATIHVRARSAISAIDDSSMLIGIPSIPLVIPGAGTVTTPELALFKRSSQRGHNKLGLYGVREDGSLAFDLGTGVGSNHHTRWTLLFLVNFTRTDLTEPYRNIGPASIGE